VVKVEGFTPALAKIAVVVASIYISISLFFIIFDLAQGDRLLRRGNLPLLKKLPKKVVY
jgi:hypothetical protein